MVTSYAEVWIEIVQQHLSGDSEAVTSYAEVWIEIDDQNRTYCPISVTSYAEVWIEIYTGHKGLFTGVWSPPTRRCGLK